MKSSRSLESLKKFIQVWTSRLGYYWLYYKLYYCQFMIQVTELPDLRKVYHQKKSTSSG